MDYNQEQVTYVATAILKTIQAGWGHDHVFNEVQPSSFKHLDIKFYDRIQQSIEKLGFKHIGDIEDQNVKMSKPNPRTFIRVSISEDSTISCAIYHAKPVFPFPLLCWFWGLGPLKVFEFETEFINGTFLTTTISSSKASVDAPGNAVKQHCDKNETAELVLKKHRELISKINREQSTEPRRLSSLDEICASQNRGIEQKRKHMEEIGWVSKEYLRRQIGENEKLVADVHQEINRLVRKQLITGQL